MKEYVPRVKSLYTCQKCFYPFESQKELKIIPSQNPFCSKCEVRYGK